MLCFVNGESLQCYYTSMRGKGCTPHPLHLIYQTSLKRLHHNTKVQTPCTGVSLLLPIPETAWAVSEMDSNTTTMSMIFISTTTMYRNGAGGGFKNGGGWIKLGRRLSEKCCTISVHVHTQDQLCGLTSTAGHDSHIIDERSSNCVSYPMIYQYMRDKGVYPTSPTSDQLNFSEKFDALAGA